MDVVGGVASISQLIAYGHSVTKSLIKLYKALQNGPAAFRDQKFKVCLLLKITEQICQRTSPKSETILLLLIQITDLIHSIINLLERRGILGINWVSFTKSETLAEAFESLSRKRELLQLHISQEGLELLNHIQSDIASMSRRADLSSTGHEGAVIQASKSVAEESSGHAKSTDSLANDKQKKSDSKVCEMKQGAAPSGSIRVEAESNTAGIKSTQNIGNGWGVVVGIGGAVDLSISKNMAGDESKQKIGNHSQDPSPPKQ